jgi:putative endonuclease
VLARNHRTRRGEIDLVAVEPDGTLVFVEVKQRSRDDHGSPGEAITAAKVARVRRAAVAFMGRDDLACRFDAVLVHGSVEDHDLQWLRDAF